VSYSLNALGVLVIIIIILVAAVYMLLDAPRIAQFANRIGGPSAAQFLRRTERSLVQYVKAQTLVSLIIGAWPAMSAYGFDFLTTQRWAPNARPNPILGGLGPIYGTLVSSLIALLIAVPVGLGIAIFLTELCPQWLRRPVGVAVELLAGIPSIIYGMWGFFVLGPLLADKIEPAIADAVEDIPILNVIFAGPASNLSLFNASLVLAIMILPFVTASARDVFNTVPPVLASEPYTARAVPVSTLLLAAVIVRFCPLPPRR
jgi:phosphate transport system permease protein